ncbi:MAG: hypothetical protein U0176_18540 [Bacteroidia bacterium]
MNQDVLSLYKKAQNVGLNAQEVFWLEGQAAAHPAFSLVHTILARHHFRNQSTIKNKALLKAAAYSNNRILLRSYLEDTLTSPKSRPIPVSEMRQNLDKKEPEAKTEETPKINLEKPVEPEVQPEVVEQPVVDAAVEEVVPAVDSVVESAKETVSNEVVSEVEPVIEASNEITPVADAASEVVVEPVIEASNEVAPVADAASEVIEEPVLEAAAEESPANELISNIESASEAPIEEAPAVVVEAPAVAEAPAVQAPSPMIGSGPSAGTINWYLQTRVKFRVDRYLGLLGKITASIEKFAPALVVAHEAAPATVETVVAAEPEVVAQEEAQPLVETPVSEAVLEVPAADASGETVESSPAIVEEPVAEVTAPVIELVTEPSTPDAVAAPELVESESEAQVVAETPAEVIESAETIVEEPILAAKEVVAEVEVPMPPVAAVAEPVAVEPVASKSHPKPPAIRPREKAAATGSDKDYEIGSFSSFTFLSDGPAEEAEDVIDTGIGTLEAVEFQTTVSGSEEAEIIFEENDRIVEISVSPAALEKYFKGRLPAEPKLSFGEFKIELDELEYRSLDEADEETLKELAAVPVDEVVVAKAQVEVVEESPKTRKRGEDLIDRFIEHEPTITRGKAGMAPTGDLSRDSSHLHDDWVTETLARIYEKQGNKSKAIKIYEKLRLRFPEKSNYFGLLIEKLKQ